MGRIQIQWILCMKLTDFTNRVAPCRNLQNDTKELRPGLQKGWTDISAIIRLQRPIESTLCRKQHWKKMVRGPLYMILLYVLTFAYHPSWDIGHQQDSSNQAGPVPVSPLPSRYSPTSWHQPLGPVTRYFFHGPFPFALWVPAECCPCDVLGWFSEGVS